MPFCISMLRALPPAMRLQAVLERNTAGECFLDKVSHDRQLLREILAELPAEDRIHALAIQNASGNMLISKAAPAEIPELLAM